MRFFFNFPQDYAPQLSPYKIVFSLHTVVVGIIQKQRDLMEKVAWVSKNHEPHKATNVLSPFPVKVSQDLKLRYHSSDCWFLSLYSA